MSIKKTTMNEREMGAKYGQEITATEDEKDSLLS